MFDFRSTAELSPLDIEIGLDRALKAVSFGIDIESPGYHIYAISIISQGIELLTGVPAGERQQDGSHPQGTLYNAVQERLSTLAKRVRSFNIFLPLTAHNSYHSYGTNHVF